MILMLIKVRRRLNREEVEKRIEELREKYGIPFEEFAEQLIKTKLRRAMLEDYIDWANLYHALKAYEENGELDYVEEEQTNLKIGEIRQIFTGERVKILEVISKGVDSISDLARKSGYRDVKNVYVDLKILERTGFVKLEKKRKNVVPRRIIEDVVIEL